MATAPNDSTLRPPSYGNEGGAFDDNVQPLDDNQLLPKDAVVTKDSACQDLELPSSLGEDLTIKDWLLSAMEIDAKAAEATSPGLEAALVPKKRKAELGAGDRSSRGEGLAEYDGQTKKRKMVLLNVGRQQLQLFAEAQSQVSEMEGDQLGQGNFEETNSASSKLRGYSNADGSSTKNSTKSADNTDATDGTNATADTDDMIFTEYETEDAEDEDSSQYDPNGDEPSDIEEEYSKGGDSEDL